MLTLENQIDIIKDLTKELESHFYGILCIEPALTRKIVSYQDNKNRPFYRWYKYKEAFSSSLVEYLLFKYKVPKGVILDPFAGIGTTLFASTILGYDSEGIELLPVGQEIISNRIFAQFKIKDDDIEMLEQWRGQCPWNSNIQPHEVNHLRITQGAYPKETEDKIGRYLSELDKIRDKKVSGLLLFAMMCILESVSFTRKDGQYLRWDHRSGRNNGQNAFNKGKILSFDNAIRKKLEQIIRDIKTPGEKMLFQENSPSTGTIRLHRGSCLNILPNLASKKYKAIITSPPYCNRYDYTRTYALEHALLGICEQELIELRQTMLSCTVENKPKQLSDISKSYSKIDNIFRNQELLDAIVEFLEEQKEAGNLNNNGIPRMVKGYFHEMTAVISECYRVLDNDGLMFMVNDNVRYAGVCIPVDLILSKIAEDIGFDMFSILILPQNKGNSSQQMGGFGRKALRKCVYIWRKP
jgi:DNA modification methylase